MIGLDILVNLGFIIVVSSPAMFKRLKIAFINCKRNGCFRTR